MITSLGIAPEALALRGRGAAFVVGSAVGSAGSSSSAGTAAAQQQAAAAQQSAAAAQQQATVAQQQAAAAQQQAAAPPALAAAPPPAVPPATGAKLPLGSVVPSLPAGCTPTPVNNVNYYYCGGNFYQAVYEGSALKYITAQPK